MQETRARIQETRKGVNERKRITKMEIGGSQINPGCRTSVTKSQGVKLVELKYTRVKRKEIPSGKKLFPKWDLIKFSEKTHTRFWSGFLLRNFAIPALFPLLGMQIFFL